MLPIRFASSRMIRCLCGFGFLLLCSAITSPIQAEPLPANGFEEFRALLDPKNPMNKVDPDTPEAITERRRAFQKAAKQLPSLGELTRVLLLPDWNMGEIEDTDSKVSLEKIRDAVKLPDDKFQKEVEGMLKKAGDDPGRVITLILAEIRRNVRLDLEERLEKDTRYYLTSQHRAERIAAANLINDTLTNLRRQDDSDIRVVLDPTRRNVSSVRFVRDSLRTLSDDLQKLTRDGDEDVRIAAIRALSDLEANAAVSAATFKPLLTSEQSSVTVRRATAQALAHALEILSTRVDKSRPQPLLQGVAQIFPVAVSGLTDSDAGVRRNCLDACQRAALLMDDLASERRAAAERLPVFKPAMDVVDQNLAAINRAARDSSPEVRYAACRVLETFVLVSHKVRNPSEQTLPAPNLVPPTQIDPPGKEPTKKKGVRAPDNRGGIRTASARTTQWAGDRAEQMVSAVTLERPVKLPTAERPARDAIRRVTFQAPDLELPVPSKVETGTRGTLDAMIANLKDRDYRVRLAAVDVLETLGEAAEPAIPALVKALEDTNKFVRWGSARTLGRLAPRRAEEVVPGLVGLLNDREDQSVRIVAAVALEQYGPAAKDAVKHLAHVINRGDKDYIIHILHTIEAIGTDAVPALSNVAWIMQSRDLPTSVRVEAAQTLAHFGPHAKDQRAALRDVMISDPDVAVRNAASTAILAIDRSSRK